LHRHGVLPFYAYFDFLLSSLTSTVTACFTNDNTVTHCTVYMGWVWFRNL